MNTVEWVRDGVWSYVRSGKLWSGRAYLFTEAAWREEFCLTPEPVAWNSRSLDHQEQWVHSDDGYVVQYLAESVYRDRGRVRRAIWTTAGRRWETGRLNVRPVVDGILSPFATADGRTEKVRVMRSHRFKVALALYVSDLLDGRVPDLKAVGAVLKPRDRRPDLWAGIVFRWTEVQEIVMNELIRRIRGLGVDEATVVRMLQEAYTVAKDQGRSDHMIASARVLGQYLNMEERARGSAFPGAFEDIDFEAEPEMEPTAALQPADRLIGPEPGDRESEGLWSEDLESEDLESGDDEPEALGQVHADEAGLALLRAADDAADDDVGVPAAAPRTG